MSEKFLDLLRREAFRRIAKIHATLSAIHFSCSGTLLERRKVCGRPNCCCAEDPAARHGPYFEWTRRHRGRLVHRVITAEQAGFIHQAIANHRKILKLLEQWERETVRVLDALGNAKR